MSIIPAFKKILLSVFLLLQVFNQIKTQGENNEKNATAVIKEPEIYKQIQSVRVKSLKVLHKLLNETDNVFFGYFYTKTSKNSLIGAEMVKAISQKLDFMVTFVLIDCEDFEPYDYKYCVKDPEAKDGFPRMVVYKQPEYRRNPYTGQRLYFTEEMYTQREVKEATIYNFITSFITGKSTILNQDNIEPFLNNNIFNKVILFTEREETSILYKGLSAFFYDRMLFGEIKKENKALIKRFGVKTFPSIIVYVTQEDNMYLDEPRIERYKGKINSAHIAYFIGEWAMSSKLYLRVEKKENLEELKYKVSFKNLDDKDYDKYLSKFISKRFIIYLDYTEEEKIEYENEHQYQMEMHKRKTSMKNIPEDVKRLSKNTNGFFLFVRFNCFGNNEQFCQETFKVDKFPSLLLIHKTATMEDKSITNDLKERLSRPIRLSMDYDNMKKEILNEFSPKMNKMNTENVGQLLGESQRNRNKQLVPMIYLYEKEIPLGLQLLSYENLYRKYVQFSEFQYPSQDILKNFRVNKVPSTIFLIKDGADPKSEK